jgi:hypothetical protein
MALELYNIATGVSPPASHQESNVPVSNDPVAWPHNITPCQNGQNVSTIHLLAEPEKILLNLPL